MKPFLTIICFATIFSCGQQKKLTGSNEDVTPLIEKQDYVFHAKTVFPTGGRAIQLTSRYDMRISKDSIVAYLPYFGRAYSAPMGTTDGAMQLTSTDFDYTVEPRKKGGWLITIKPKDNLDIQQMFLTVSKGGSGSLQVTSNNRQPITYNGHVGL